MIKLTAATRLRASLISKKRVVLRAVIEYMRDNGHRADYTDDDMDMVIVYTHHGDVVDTLDAHRWTKTAERMDEGGTMRKGNVTVMTGGPFELKVMAVGHERTIVCKS
jgi:hypothetical protein